MARKEIPQSSSAPASHQRPVLLGFAVRRRAPSGRWQVHFRWGRIVACMAVLLLLSYVLLVGFMYAFLKYKRDYDLSIQDAAVFLIERDEIREQQGERDIELAKELLKKAEFRDAFRLLQAGVARSRDNLEGVMLLAQFYAEMGRPENALDVMERSLEYGFDDSGYISQYFRLLFQRHRYKDVVNMSEMILAEDPGPGLARVLRLNGAQAALARGNFSKAEDFINDASLIDTLDHAVLSARLRWERGQREAAIKHLQDSIDVYSSNERIYRLLTEYHLQQGNTMAAQRYALERNVQSPLSYGPRVDLIRVMAESGEMEQAKETASTLLRQFRDNERALLELGNFAANYGQPELASEIYMAALENNFSLESFALLVIESHITAGQFTQAILFTDEIAEDSPRWLEGNRSVFDSLRAVAHIGNGNVDEAELAIKHFLSLSNTPNDAMIVIADRLMEVDAPAFARRVLEKAFVRNPRDQRALTRLIRISLETGDTSKLSDHFNRLMDLRRPRPDLLQHALDELGSDRFLYTTDREDLLNRIDRLLAESRREQEA